MAAVTPIQISNTVPVSPIFVGALPIGTEWRQFFTTLLNRTGGTTGTDVNNVKIKSSQITDAGLTGIAVLQSQTPAAARTAIGAGTSNLTVQLVAAAIAGTGIDVGYDAEADQIELSIAPSGVTPGAYGGAGSAVALTIGEDGRITNASTVAGNLPDIGTLWMYA